ncbi:hypothetical protein K2X33_06845 [bacterium]|nr:hypothetical protein [bacterium]
MDRRFWLGISLVCAQAFGVLEQVAEIPVSTGVPAWNQKITQAAKDLEAQGTSTKDGYAQCAETQEIEGAYLCGYTDVKNMNLAFTRISLFTEGNFGHKKGTLPLQNSPLVAQGIQYIGGHDLRKKHLVEFFELAEKECPTNANACLNKQEKELYDDLIEPLEKGGKDFVVVTYAIRSFMSWRDVVTHEIMHAQYFLQSKFQQVADDFWLNDVREEDKKYAKQELSQYYDIQDDYLVRNEFQAYMLMAGASRSVLARLVPLYRDRLLDELHKVNVEPVQVH